jgi:hypothetical protein
MSKNFFSLKFDHPASDKYFKNMAVWYDSDMLTSWVLGFLTGIIVMPLVLMLL